MKRLIKRAAATVGLGLTRAKHLKNLESLNANYGEIFEYFVRSVGQPCDSHGQLKQDLFAVIESGFKRGGFFVEFGATDGKYLSNTYLLEKAYDWSGILAEPGIGWHDDLKRNRPGSSIDFDCVWRESGEKLKFVVAEDAAFSGVRDTITKEDGRTRNGSNSYEVNSVSLMDLLARHNAPSSIDYLSIDTEGSEYEILSSFDFNKYNISIITCEHNYTDKREKIYDLLTRRGYTRKLSEFSKWDDWYVRN